MAVPFTASLLVILVIAVLYGLGFSTVTSSTVVLVSDLASESGSGSVMGFLSTIMDVGQTTGPIITGLIIGTTLQYLDGFWFLGISLIATAVLFAWFFRSHVKER